jgi:hypothetical protein
MKTYFLFIFPALMLFPSCMHVGMHGMPGMHREDSGEQPLTVHVMDERHHVDITIHPGKNGYTLFTFSVTNARTNISAEGIEGWLIDEPNNLEVPLLPDQTKIGVYAAVMSIDFSRQSDNLLLLELSNDDEEISIFEFTLQQSHQHDEHRCRRTRGINLTTAAIIGGAAMAVMMVVVHGWWIFR